jgi:hypothetical protein
MQQKLDQSEYVFQKISRYIFETCSRWIFEEIATYVFEVLSRWIFGEDLEVKRVCRDGYVTV